MSLDIDPHPLACRFTPGLCDHREVPAEAAVTASPNSRSVEFRFRAICPVTGEVRVRTRATCGTNPSDGLRTRSRASASHSRSAAYLPILQGSGKLRTAIERTNSLVALAVRPFAQWGHTGFVNLFGTLSARSSSFLTFVNGSAKPTNGIANAFLFPPIPFVAAAAHESNSRRRNVGNAQKPIGEVRNVVR